MNDFSKNLDFLKKQGAPIEEIRLLEILKNEEEWSLLSKEEKQKKICHIFFRKRIRKQYCQYRT